MYGNWATGTPGADSAGAAELFLHRHRQAQLAASYQAQQFAFGPGAASSRLLGYGSPADSLLRRQVVAQQQHAVAQNLVNLEGRVQDDRDSSAPVPNDSTTNTTPANSENLALRRAIDKHKTGHSSPKFPASKDVIEIDDSSDDGDNEVEVTSTVPSKASSKSKKKKRKRRSQELSGISKLRKVANKDGQQKPLVVVQNWSRESLLEELKTHNTARVQMILLQILFHATGHTAATAPKNVIFPPSKVDMTIMQIHNAAKAIVQEQTEALKTAIDTTFNKCACFVQAAPKAKKAAGGSSSPGMVGGEGAINLESSDDEALPTRESPAKDHGRTPIETAATATTTSVDKTNEKLAEIIRQKDRIIRDQKNKLEEVMLKLSKTVVDQKKETNAFQKERAYLKEQNSRAQTIHKQSLQAYLIASVQSLRSLRQTMGADQSEDDEAEQTTGNTMAIV